MHVQEYLIVSWLQSLLFMTDNTGIQDVWGLEVCNGFRGFGGTESKNRIHFCPSGQD